MFLINRILAVVFMIHYFPLMFKSTDITKLSLPVSCLLYTFMIEWKHFDPTGKIRKQNREDAVL